MESNRRQFMVAGGTTVASITALSAPAAAGTHGSPQSGDSDAYDYPVLGADADAPVLTVFGSFNCPYTASMIDSSFRDIVEEFVEPGRLTLEFRALEYEADGDPWISQNGVLGGQAAMGVWEEDPDSFWDFFVELWTHMPGQVDANRLEGIMDDAGVDDAGHIADNLESWDSDLRATAAVADDEGVSFTPTLELEGDLGNRHSVLDWIEQRLDGDGADFDDEADAPDGSDTQDETDESDEADTQDEADASEGSNTQDESDEPDEPDTQGDADASGGEDESAGEGSTDQSGGRDDEPRYCSA